MRIYILLLLACILAGCAQDERVIVDIEDPQYKEKYLEVLDDTGLGYEVLKSGKIAVDVENADVLRSRMEKYYEYRTMRTQELNEMLNK